jgi:hypothetical protein
MNLNLSRMILPAFAALAAAAAVSASAQETNRVGPRPFSDFKLFAERNIFDPNRRAPVVGGRRNNPPPVDTFALTGTMSYESGNFAVFDGNNSDYRKVLPPGGRIAGHTIVTVTDGSVNLSSGTNAWELKVGMQLQRGPDGKWSVGQQRGDMAFTGNSNNRFGGNQNRNNRNASNGNERRFNFGNGNSFSGRNNREGRNFGGSGGGFGGNSNENRQQDGGETPAAVMGEAAPRPAMGNEPTDPVERLIWRRMQEVGGNGNQNNDGDQDNRGESRDADSNNPTQTGNEGNPQPDTNDSDAYNILQGGNANSPQNSNPNNEN